MQQNFRKFIPLLLFLLCLALFAGIILLPTIFILKDVPFMFAIRLPLLIVGGVMLVFTIVISIIAGVRAGKKVNVKKMDDLIGEEYKYAREQLSAYQKKMHRLSLIIKVYIVFTFIVALATAFSLAHYGIEFFYIRNGDDVELGILAIAASLLLFMVAYGGVIDYVSLSGAPQPIGFALTQEESAFLYGFLDRAAAKLNMSKSFVLSLIADANVMVLEYKTSVLIAIGTPVLQMLNREELETVIFHELAHVRHQDGKNTSKYSKLNAFLFGGAIPFWHTFVSASFSWLKAKYAERYELYSWCNTYDSEVAADLVVKTNGDSVTYISACAKIEYYSIFCEQLPTYNVYESPTKKKNYNHFIFEQFLKSYAQQKEQWQAIADRTLRMRRPTHPTYPERKVFFGIDDVQVDFKNSDFEWTGQKSKLLERLDLELYNTELELYAKAREDEYGGYLKGVHEYESLSSEAIEKTESIKLIQYAEDYYCLTNYDKCLEICNYIENKFSKAARTSLMKGLILLDRFDVSGIDYIKKTAEENVNYTQNAAERLSAFALRAGDMQLKEELTQWIHEAAQKQIDSNYDLYRYHRSDRYIATTLPQPAIDMIIEKAKSLPYINELRIITKKGKNGQQLQMVGMRLNKATSYDQFNESYNKMFFMLDNSPELADYDFTIVSPEVDFFKAKFKKGGNQIHYKK